MSIAKTLPPFLPGLFKRSRLFKLLDQYKRHPAIWVQGQAGAGKTCLVADYINQCQSSALWYRIDAGDDDPATFFHYFSHAAYNLIPDPKFRLPQVTSQSKGHLTPFAALFFREMFAVAAKPVTLVFDNMHTLADNCLMHDVFPVMLSQVPNEVTVIMISRDQPPASLSRMVVNRNMAVLDQDQLKLTDDDVKRLADLWHRNEISPDTLRHMNELTGGWIAGLVLLFERGAFDGPVTKNDHEYFFGYFASEIFDTLDPGRQKFLLHTAFLPCITPQVAAKLTEVGQAFEILEDLCSRYYFTTKSARPEPVYQYHPLFKDFLLAQAGRKLSLDEIKHIAATAAGILAETGLTDDAVTLAKTFEQYALMGDLIHKQAPDMLAQQRLQQLEQWIAALPSDILNASPWLLYWFGCCRLVFDHNASQKYYEKAYKGFKAHNDTDGMLMSASGVILAIMTGWDDFHPLARWISVLDKTVEENFCSSSPPTQAMVVLAMLSALLFHRPEHPKMEYWEACAQKNIRDNTLDISLRMDTGNALAHWQFWKGDLAGAAHTIEILSLALDAKQSAIMPRLQSDMNQAILHWHRADFGRCREKTDQGLALADEMQIHILDDRLVAQSIIACLSSDDIADAGRLLARMKQAVKNKGRLSLSFYYYLSSLYHLLTKDFEMALQQGRTAVELNKEAGAPYPEALTALTLAQIHFKVGDVVSAHQVLADACEAGRAMNSRTLELICELTWAWFKFDQGEKDVLYAHLENAFSLQKKMGFINFPGWWSGMMNPLLVKALEFDIESQFLYDLVRKRGLKANSKKHISENWPWPVKIYTFGGFAIYIDGQRLQFKGKAQQKPLELLKTLIALGGTDIRKDRLMDLLWPDTEGDKASRALETTLHRFRKLIQNKGIIQVQEAKVSINPELCRLDTWAMEYLFAQVETLFMQKTPDPATVLQYQQQLILLHKGPFLKDDDQPGVILSYRGQMDDRYLNRLGRIGSYWEGLKKWDQAIAFYCRLLELDPRQEYFHRRLIVSYKNKGLISEALAAYERCRETLLFHYGIAPSLQTKALLKSLNPNVS